jgi:hypothetical protein
MSYGTLIRLHTQTLSEIVHLIDCALVDGAFIGQDSMSDFHLRQSEEKLRSIADGIASRRRRLLADQPALPFLQAAE